MILQDQTVKERLILFFPVNLVYLIAWSQLGLNRESAINNT